MEFEEKICIHLVRALLYYVFRKFLPNDKPIICLALFPSKNDLHDLPSIIMARRLGKIKSCKNLAKFHARFCQDNVKQEIAKTSYVHKSCQVSCKILARSCKAVQSRNCQDVLQDSCQVSCKIKARILHDS